MGNVIYLTSSCWDRKKAEFSEYMNKEGAEPVYHASFKSSYGKSSRDRSALQGVSPPLSGRGVDRDEHILLSARSIAIQKKAPLFRDNDEEEFLQHEQGPPQLSARKLDMDAIRKMVQEDRTSSSVTRSPSEN